MENLSNRFYGNKIVTEEIYNQLKECISDISQAQTILSNLWPDIIQNLESKNKDLVPIYLDYLYMNIEFCIVNKIEFKKASTFIELSNAVFYNSLCLKNLSQDDSFNYFKDFLVRHSLFRPPHSICIFNLDDLKIFAAHMINTFYNHYQLYFFSFTPKYNVEIRTFEMFKSRFPFVDNLKEASQIKRGDVKLLQEYLIDKETGMTPEQLEVLMQGDNIEDIPLKKRQEWLKLKEEREKKRKIDKIMKKELERINDYLESKIKIQDEEFIQKLQDFKIKKK